jgi:hypothetical protein
LGEVCYRAVQLAFSTWSTSKPRRWNRRRRRYEWEKALIFCKIKWENPSSRWRIRKLQEVKMCLEM